MKNLILGFLLMSSTALAQKVYQLQDVDVQAEPAGGAEVLNLFFSSNVRVPVKVGWRGINNRVFVKAVIETDGGVTGVQVIRGIDTLCNAEAIRVMKLYKAWKPASIKQSPVRQEISVSIPFKSAPIFGYDSIQSSIVTYFDKGWLATTEPKDYNFRRSIPVDEFGYMNGNIAYHQKKKNSWDFLSNIPFQKEHMWENITELEEKDSVQAIKFSATIAQLHTPVYQVVIRQENGKILTHNEFNDAGSLSFSKSYYLNGTLRGLKSRANGIWREVSWYANGQLASIVQRPDINQRPFVYTINEGYDEKGNHLINKGNGYFGAGILESSGFEGQGRIKEGLKDGLWISKSKDSTLLFEEYYENGKLQNGTSYSKGQKMEYSEVEVQPEFDGGAPQMYRYIGQNLRYPKDAAKSNIQGMVFTSFVVCEDGTLCDFRIIKGLDKSIDKEALRVIESMSGKWKPGRQRGRKVRVKYNLPINFVLQ